MPDKVGAKCLIYGGTICGSNVPAAYCLAERDLKGKYCEKKIRNIIVLFRKKEVDKAGRKLFLFVGVVLRLETCR